MRQTFPHYCTCGYVAESQRDLEEHITSTNEGDHQPGR